MDESRLIRQIQKGDTGALEQAIRRFTPYVSAAAYRVLGPNMPREDLEEVVSDAFVSLWNHAATLEPERGTLRAWLGTTAANAAKNKLRSFSPSLPLDEEVSAAGTPADEVEREDAAQRLWRAVEELGEPDVTLFFRYYYEGEKLKDIARELGIKESTVKTRMARGRKLLEEKLREMGEMEV